MNLWVRTLRQLAVLAVALFFFSCEDESSILGFKNPNKKFKVGYVDIPLDASSVLSIDSLITDLRPVVVRGQSGDQTQFVDGILVGEYADPDFGKITARSFLTLYPSATSALATSAVYDSITVQFRLNFFGYGFTGNHQQRIAVHEITGDTLTLFGGNRYYMNSPAPQYSTEPLGEAVISVNYDSLRKQDGLNTGQDTLLARGRLSDDFGMRIFNNVKEGLTGTGQTRLFKAGIKGLALVPAGDPGIVGFNVVNNFGQVSRVVLHYHTLDDNGAVDDTLSRTFGVDFASFAKIEADRAGTELAAMQPYESVQTLSGLRYIQSGAPVITKLDLSRFYEFADTLENILINSAELVIEDPQVADGQHPHDMLILRLMNSNSDQFLNSRVAADRDMLNQSRYQLSLIDRYYTPTMETNEPVTIRYDKEENHFSGFLTVFTQSLFMNKNDDDGINDHRLKYMALYPFDPSVAFDPSAPRNVARTVFHKDNVRLRIFYTRANPVTP